METAIFSNNAKITVIIVGTQFEFEVMLKNVGIFESFHQTEHDVFIYHVKSGIKIVDKNKFDNKIIIKFQKSVLFSFLTNAASLNLMHHGYEMH